MIEKTNIETIKKELEASQAECQKLNKQLVSLLIHHHQKLELILKLKLELQQLKKISENKSTKTEIGKLIKLIELDKSLEINWEQFTTYYNEGNQGFLKKLASQFPKLTPKDYKLCAFLRLNLSTKEIAHLLNISVRGVEISRYRLRKKLNLESNQNLMEYLLKF